MSLFYPDNIDELLKQDPPRQVSCKRKNGDSVQSALYFDASEVRLILDSLYNRLPCIKVAIAKSYYGSPEHAKFVNLFTAIENLTAKIERR